MPDRLRAAFSPARPGGYLASCPAILTKASISFLIHLIYNDKKKHFKKHPSTAQDNKADILKRQVSTQVREGRQNARRDRVCLEFLVLFVQAKRMLTQAAAGLLKL